MNPLSTTPSHFYGNATAQNVCVVPPTTSSAANRLARTLFAGQSPSTTNSSVRAAYLPSTNSQHVWASNMLTASGLALDQQAGWIEHMNQRAERLGYGVDNPLFAVIDRDVLFKTKLVKPLDDVKLIMADLYRQKYGIRLVPEVGKFMEPRDMKRWVEYHLQQANGEEVAFLTRTEEPGKELHERNYLWHLTPFVFRESPERLEVLNLDSAWRVDPGMYKVLALMAEDGRQIDFLTLKQKRQADYGSCHVDAVVVAKDALRAFRESRFQNPGGSLLQHFDIHSHPEQADLVHHNVRSFISELPSFLHKTTQYSKAMRFDSFDPEALVMSRKQQSISEHRNKYTRSTLLIAPPINPEVDPKADLTAKPSQRKAINHFLTFKGFYLVERALYHLESSGSKEAAQQYVAELQNHYAHSH